ncbi:MAG: hypothetical protein K6U12_13960 [Armatimonadetes bacterium]|nr:hypothetical protein [Armatimonadota bacterium]
MRLSEIYCRDPYTGADWDAPPAPAPLQGVRRRRPAPPVVREEVPDEDNARADDSDIPPKRDTDDD